MSKFNKEGREPLELVQNRFGRWGLRFRSKAKSPSPPSLVRKGLLNPSVNENQGGSYFTKKTKR